MRTRSSPSFRFIRCLRVIAGGATSFLVVMALVVGGYLAATISLVFGGGAATRHRRLLRSPSFRPSAHS